MPNPFIPLAANCLEVRFVRRIRRFTVETVRNGEIFYAHCNDTGAMTGLCRQGAKAIISPAVNKNRKLSWTLEMLKPDRAWVSVNTLWPNRMLELAFRAGALDFAQGYGEIKREAVCGKSRLDACLTGVDRSPLWLECKSVTLVEDGAAFFPDSPSARARKHVQELLERVEKGEKAGLVFMIQREDADCFSPADFIDEEFAEIFRVAVKKGVQAHAYRINCTPKGALLDAPVKIIL